MKEQEPDWKEIAIQLWRQVNFALSNLKAPGSGIIMQMEPGASEYKMRHWREEFADALELIPGIKVDREAMYYPDMTAKEKKAFKKQQESEKANSSPSDPVPLSPPSADNKTVSSATGEAKEGIL